MSFEYAVHIFKNIKVKALRRPMQVDYSGIWVPQIVTEEKMTMFILFWVGNQQFEKRLWVRK